MRLLVPVFLLCVTLSGQPRIEETFFISTPNFLTGSFRAPFGAPLWVGTAEDDSVVLLGSTFESELPVLNAAQPEFAAGLCSDPVGTFTCGDLYLARFLPGGQGPAYMTYLGGQQWDVPRDLAVAPDGTAYILGEGDVEWMPLTADLANSGPPPGERDAFLLTVSPSGAPERFVRLPQGRHYSLDVDAAGSAYITGSMHSNVEPINGFGNEAPEITLYRSLDGGDAWTAHPTEAPPNAVKLVALESNGATQLFSFSRDASLPVG